MQPSWLLSACIAAAHHATAAHAVYFGFYDVSNESLADTAPFSNLYQAPDIDTAKFVAAEYNQTSLLEVAACVVGWLVGWLVGSSCA